ncbi:hypothetical protein CONPUDRAFT_146514 [Coniophora puteana RWD-64-598 SS2]|uniref:Uncharacterized protein n=1 Tax=Coniophora puteana (strain RWD-64-598) TaxID=741705 RepID=A0A5M3MBX3_CONPW|nr:uncharacterized protein CONPUDRAFT_146514 [Coniophora puteana RWD-64-598 SS2]EIW76722.1 hypothetical protein CONPUDRAFT_146514 [Coniophora puteana RWD-64-598 SS2]
MFGLPQGSWGASQIDARAAGLKSCFRTNIQVAFIVLGHLVLLTFGWSFIAVLLRHENHQIPLPDIAAQIAAETPRGVTYLASLVATVLSLVSTWLFSKAVLILLNTALLRASGGDTKGNPAYMKDFHFLVTLSNTRYFWSLSYPKWMVLSFVVFVLIHTTVSGWTALLNPTSMLAPGYVTGSELDVATPAFEDFFASASYYLEDSRDLILDMTAGAYKEMLGLATLAGQSAAGTDFYEDFPNFFNYNGASYSFSTGGILPAIPEYVFGNNQLHTNVTTNGWGLYFMGGYVPIDTKVVTKIWGQSHNYTVRQQGLTANVSCTQIAEGAIQSESGPVMLPSSLWDGDSGFQFWRSQVQCAETGGPLNLTNPYVTQTWSNNSDTAACIASGFLPIIPCPLQNITGADNNSFVIHMSGECKYSSIGSTLCQVTPYVTEIDVLYDSGVIYAWDIITQYPLGATNPAIMTYFVGLVYEFGLYAQGYSGNTAGDAVNFITSTLPETFRADINNILENYWRGVIEFGGTYLRSGFSANSNLTSDMKSSINGNIYAQTVGWSKGWSYRAVIALIFAMVPQTLVSLLTFFILYQSGGDRLGFPPDFDPSDVSDALLATDVNGVCSQSRDAAFEGKVIRLRTEDGKRRMLTIESSQQVQEKYDGYGTDNEEGHSLMGA